MCILFYKGWLVMSKLLQKERLRDHATSPCIIINKTKQNSISDIATHGESRMVGQVGRGRGGGAGSRQ